MYIKRWIYPQNIYFAPKMHCMEQNALRPFQVLEPGSEIQ